MSQPLVSIIIPNYNHANYLEERIFSILNQSYQNFELIILDDSSTDNSLDILDKYVNNDKVSYFVKNTKNSGSPFKQWKKGLKLAKGDYVWIAESDDYCALNFIESQLNKLSQADISVAKTCIITKSIGNEKVINHPVFNDSTNVILKREQFVHCPITNISTVIFKNLNSNKLLNSKFENYNLIGDLVFYYEIFNGLNVIYNEDTISYFRKMGLSNLTNKSLKYFNTYFDEHVRFIKYVNNSENKELKYFLKPYIKKHFYKIRHRKTFKQKMSILFIFIFLKYKWQMLIN